MGTFIALVGFIGIGIGIVAAIKGTLPRFHLASRKQAAGLIAGAFIVMTVGAGIAGQNLEPVNDAKPTPAPTASDSPTPTPSETPTPSPSPTPVPPPPPPPSPTSPQGVPEGTQKAKVAHVVDGDTIWVEVTEPGGPLPPAAVHKIRILEIDTPESTTTIECFGPEASNFAKAEFPIGSTVYLLADREDKDRYGRFLRYAWKADGVFYNDKSVRQGFAKAVLYRPNDKYISQMRAAEAEARAANRGLWAACKVAAPAPVPVAPPAPIPVAPPPPPAAPPAGNCDASYPDFCIPPSPPDLNCPDIPQKQFTVRQPDPHGFDRDQDGIGCET